MSKDYKFLIKKRILFFSKDPGGANTIIPLVNPLKKIGTQILLYGQGIALQKYKAFNLSGRNINEHLKKVSRKNINVFLKEINPDLVITGTSANGFTEKYLWSESERLQIPAIALLDQWMNYGIRFSPYQISEISKYLENPKHSFIPRLICVMDSYAKKEMIKIGIPVKNIAITGHPYFELIKQQKNTSSNFRKKFKIPKKDFLIVFASEPISLEYSKNFWGYTEISILESLMEALEKIKSESKINISLLIKPHPKENIKSFNKFKDFGFNLKILDNSLQPLEIIKASDLICGMSSMFLIESLILKKPVLSIQIGLKREDPFIFSKRKKIKSILSKDDLYKKLKLLIVRKRSLKYNFELVSTPVENVIKQMEKILR